MNPRYYDLCVKTAKMEVLKQAASLGWTGVCVALEMEEARKARLPGRVDGMEVYLGAVISNNVEGNACKALDFADIVLASGGSDEVNRQASESWEVDILLHPEYKRERDYMDYKNAGLDHVMASYMAERGIALGVDFSQFLLCSGRNLVTVVGRIRQNIKVALKYKVPVVLTSCAKDAFGLRSPLDLASVNELIGVPEHVARKVVSSYPEFIVQKMKARNNADVILKGLQVLDWSNQKPRDKRKYGWY